LWQLKAAYGILTDEGYGAYSQIIDKSSKARLSREKHIIIIVILINQLAPSSAVKKSQVTFDTLSLICLVISPPLEWLPSAMARSILNLEKVMKSLSVWARQLTDLQKNLSGTNALAYFATLSSLEEKVLEQRHQWPMFFLQTFYGRKLRLFIIS
jgi:hypothetical protein